MELPLKRQKNLNCSGGNKKINFTYHLFIAWVVFSKPFIETIAIWYFRLRICMLAASVSYKPVFPFLFLIFAAVSETMGKVAGKYCGFAAFFN